MYSAVSRDLKMIINDDEYGVRVDRNDASA